MKRMQRAKCETADLRHIQSAYHKFLKKQKNRIERRRAKIDPECIPGYKKFAGYET